MKKFKSISVIQNIHINYCNNPRVKKCYQYNPLDLKILDVSTDPFSNIISSWSFKWFNYRKACLEIIKTDELNIINFGARRRKTIYKKYIGL